MTSPIDNAECPHCDYYYDGGDTAESLAEQLRASEAARARLEGERDEARELVRELIDHIRWSDLNALEAIGRWDAERDIPFAEVRT